MPCDWLPSRFCHQDLPATMLYPQTSFCELCFFLLLLLFVVLVRHFVTTMRKVILTPRRDMNCPCQLLFLQCAIFCSPFRPLGYGTEKYQFSLSSFGPWRDFTCVQGHRYLDGLKVRGPKSSPISTSLTLSKDSK